MPPRKKPNLTGRIFLKLIAAVFCVLVVALTAVDFLASKVAERTYLHKLTQELVDKEKMLQLASAVDLGRSGDPRFVSLAHAAGGRLTVISPAGIVIADSDANPAQMENHSTRPEIISALHGSPGSDTRLSQTVGIRFLYVAIPIPEGAMRLAVPLRDIDAQVAGIRNQLLASVALAFLPAIIVAELSSPATFLRNSRPSLNMPGVLPGAN